MFFIIPAFIDVEVDNFRVLREITFGELMGTLEYALFDEGTGREFQSFRPAHYLRSALDSSDGDHRKIGFSRGAARFASWLQSAGQSERSYSSRRAANAQPFLSHPGAASVSSLKNK